MLPSFLLSLREGLEAALIIGIVFGVLTKLNRSHLKPVVWQGVALALALSLGAGLLLNRLGMVFEGRFEEIFEGIAMLMAAGILTWMILWMQRQGSQIKQNLENETRLALQKGRRAIFFLAFIAVFREGLELVIFLMATSLVSGGASTVIGALAGLVAAVVVGWALFTSTRRLSLQKFFQVSNILLIIFAAGLVGLGVHELNEAGWIPPIIEHVWDINPVLSDTSELGLVLKALVGYNGNPSLTEVLAYSAYFLLLAVNYVRFQLRQRMPETAQA
jgi:high-affinity iron transporter